MKASIQSMSKKAHGM